MSTRQLLALRGPPLARGAVVFVSGVRGCSGPPLVELAMVVDALSIPETLDRNKSLYLLKWLLEDLKPEALQAQRAPLIRQLGVQLVDMASLQQPIIHEPATEVLKPVGGAPREPRAVEGLAGAPARLSGP